MGGGASIVPSRWIIVCGQQLNSWGAAPMSNDGYQLLASQRRVGDQVVVSCRSGVNASHFSSSIGSRSSVQRCL